MKPNPPILRSLDPSSPDPRMIREAARALDRGDLVIVPTETVYGLAGDPSRPGVLDRIHQAKGRPSDKQVPRMAATASQVLEAGAESFAPAKALMDAFWPGPLTLVLRTGAEFTGFRVPDYPVMQTLLKETGRMLAVTSANRSGRPPALTAADAAAALEGWVTMVLDAGPSPGGVPSTVVRVEGERVEILREGAIAAERIHRVASGAS